MTAPFRRPAQWVAASWRPDRRAAQAALLRQFVQFGAAGGIGFCFDTLTVYSLRGLLGLYGAGAAAYVVAASVTWAINRVWAFRGRGTHPPHRQLGLFLLTNLAGFTLNRGVYAALVTWSALCARQPVIALAAGTTAGMFINFTMARRVVFR